MAVLPLPQTGIPFLDPQTGAVNLLWRNYLNALTADIAAISALPAVVNRFALADQPFLTSLDAGYLALVSDYGNHLVRWDGTAWQWADDGNGFLRDFAVAPPVNSGWALCDGSATTLLVVGGASLTTTPFTTPDLVGTPAYKKSGPAYSGTIAAANGATDTGTSDSGGVDHTHQFTTAAPFNDTFDAAGGAAFSAGEFHQHAGTTAGASAFNHQHGLPGLGVGTIDMARLAVLPYVRR